MDPAQLELSAVGARLVGGQVRVVGRRERADGVCRLLLRGPGSPPSLRQDLTLRLAANARRAKEIAAELGVSVSTVSSELGAGLARMGLRRNEIGLLRGAGICARCCADDGTVCWTPLSSRLPAGLTPTEREIARALLGGGSNREIAAARGRSSHTIANQIAAAFRRLGISSRAELFAGLWLSSVAPPPCDGQISLAS